MPIRLPLRAHACRTAIFRIGAFAGFGGAICLLGAIVLVIGVTERPWRRTELILILIWPGALAAACYFLAMALSCAAELLRPSPPLILEKDRLLDRRTRVSLPWSSVASARLMRTRGGIGAVNLTLKAPIDVRRNPFRPGFPISIRRRKPNELHVPVIALEVDARVLGETIVCLVRENGGVVETPRMLL